jgi:hypothetical protein
VQDARTTETDKAIDRNVKFTAPFSFLLLDFYVINSVAD